MYLWLFVGYALDAAAVRSRGICMQQAAAPLPARRRGARVVRTPRRARS